MCKVTVIIARTVICGLAWLLKRMLLFTQKANSEVCRQYRTELEKNSLFFVPKLKWQLLSLLLLLLPSPSPPPSPSIVVIKFEGSSCGLLMPLRNLTTRFGCFVGSICPSAAPPPPPAFHFSRSSLEKSTSFAGLVSCFSPPYWPWIAVLARKVFGASQAKFNEGSSMTSKDRSIYGLCWLNM